MPDSIQTVAGSIDEQLRQIYDTMSPEFGSAVSLGQSIGLLGAGCYVAYRLWRTWSESNPIVAFEYFRPLILALVLACYVPLVNGFQAIGESMEQGTYQGVMDKQKQKDELSAKVETERMKAVYFAIKGEKWNDANGSTITWDAIWQETGVSDTFKYLGESLKDSMSDMLMTFFEVLYATARVAIKAMSVFFQIILFMFGPIVIGLSCFDWFSQSLPSYVGRIINVMLWAPIANIISMMLSSVEIALLKRTLEMYQKEGQSGFVSNDFSMMVFFLLGALCYFMIPVISGWMITALEGAGSHAGMGAASAAGGAIASGAGAVAGNVAGGIRTAGKTSTIS